MPRDPEPPRQHPTATPPLLGFLALDAASYDPLKGFFRWRDVELDARSGFHLHLVDVANPSVCGELYALARAEAARTGDAAAARLFRDEEPPAEPEDDRRRKLMDTLATMLAVSAAERPCIVFTGAGQFETIATFRLEPTWYSTPEARGALGGVLLEWIAALQLDGSGATDAGRPALAEALRAELGQVRRRVEAALGR